MGKKRAVPLKYLRTHIGILLFDVIKYADQALFYCLAETLIYRNPGICLFQFRFPFSVRKTIYGDFMWEVFESVDMIFRILMD